MSTAKKKTGKKSATKKQETEKFKYNRALNHIVESTTNETGKLKRK